MSNLLPTSSNADRNAHTQSVNITSQKVRPPVRGAPSSVGTSIRVISVVGRGSESIFSLKTMLQCEATDEVSMDAFECFEQEEAFGHPPGQLVATYSSSVTAYLNNHILVRFQQINGFPGWGCMQR